MTPKILIIGGGPGGYVAAIRAAQLHAEVTLVENGQLGGTCLNVGCIPTKALLHTAQLYEEISEAAAYGINATPVIDFDTAQKYKARVVNQLVNGVKGLMKANKVKVLNGTATFTTKATVQVDGKEVPFDKVIIATGSTPAIPPIPGIHSPQCINSTGALALTEVPNRLVIVGGGVIGIEMAAIYRALGSEVTIVEAQEEILPPIDREIATLLRERLVAVGTKIEVGATVEEITDKVSHADITVRTSAGQTVVIPGDKVLVAVGRRANTAALGLDAVGIVHDRGQITVDAQQQTNLPNVYAIGDCTGGSMLAHVASAQGEVAAENALGHPASYDGKTNPACVYTDPEIAGVGLTEEQVKAQKINYLVGRFPLSANGKSLIMGADGLVKIIASEEHGEILGVHIIGPRATDLIAIAGLALGTESTLEDVMCTIFAHPTVSEALREAALAARKRAIHIPNR